MKTSIASKLAALACTILLSSACVLGAVGPAEAGAAGHVVRIVA